MPSNTSLHSGLPAGVIGAARRGHSQRRAGHITADLVVNDRVAVELKALRFETGNSDAQMVSRLVDPGGRS